MRYFYLILTLLVLSACTDGAMPTSKKNESDAAAKPNASDQLTITKLDTEMYNGLALESKTYATTGTMNTTTKIITLYDVKSSMVKDTTITAVLTAPLGELFLSDNAERSMGRSDLLLSGNVRLLRMSDGGTMDVPALHYKNKEAKIFSVGGPVRKNFKVGENMIHSTSDAFEANKDLTEFEDTGNIHLTFKPDTSTTDTLKNAKP